MPNEQKLDTNVQYTLNRLIRLHSMKSDKINKYWKYKREYSQREIDTKTEDGYTNYHLNVWFAVVNTKKAEILNNIPKYDFVWLDEEGRRHSRVRQLFWKYIWDTSGTNAAVDKIVEDATKYWSWFWLEHIVQEKRNVSNPKLNEDWTYEWKEEEIVEYEGCKLEHINWNQVFLNGNNIENTTEAIIIKFFDYAEFLEVFWNNPIYKNIWDVRPWKYYYINNGTNELSIYWNPLTTDRATNSVENDETVSVLYYWNKYKDKYQVIANNVEILDTHIPFTHKQIPIVVYTDYQMEDNIYGIGELELTEKSRKLKNDTRSLIIESIKVQWGIITIDPDSDFDDNVMRLWVRQYAKVEKDAFWFFAPNINTNSLEYIDNKIDEDIIVETWLDFKAQMGSNPYATNENIKGKADSAMKRIKLNIKYNSYNFYERLARLRSANMEMWYWSRSKTIPTQWIEVDDNGNVTTINKGYWLFTMKPEYFKGKVALIPIADSLFGDTTTEMKQKFLEVFQILVNLKNEDWSPVVPIKSLVESWRGIIDDVVDLDKLLETSVEDKSVDELLAERGEMPSPLAPTTSWGNANEIPPEQKSWRPILLPSSPNL